jgi:hypothetical protein
MFENSFHTLSETSGNEGHTAPVNRHTAGGQRVRSDQKRAEPLKERLGRKKNGKRCLAESIRRRGEQRRQRDRLVHDGRKPFGGYSSSWRGQGNILRRRGVVRRLHAATTLRAGRAAILFISFGAKRAPGRQNRQQERH